MAHSLRGIVPPVVTPLTADHELDLPALRTHIDYMLSKGVHGIFGVGMPVVLTEG